MPIYEYRCSSCGHQKEFLQKLSDPPHTVCPECGQATFSKMLTAAGFQLKGTGWYVTDFRNGSTAPAKKEAATTDAKPDAAVAAEGGKPDAGKADAVKPESGTAVASTPAAKPDAPAPAA
jgi:putative FmdB family regulatory protein